MAHQIWKFGKAIRQIFAEPVTITEEDQPPTAVIRDDTTNQTDATIIRDTLVNHYST